MTKKEGFSLLEVLISLALITTAALAIIEQQWRLTQLKQQLLTRSLALLELDNNSERIIAGLAIVAHKPFQITLTQPANLELNWQEPHNNQTCCLLQRQLFVHK